MEFSIQNKNAEIQFFENFDHDAGYDRFEDSSYDFILRLFKDAVAPKPNEILIDFGCGTGSFTNRLLQTFPTLNVSGMDISQKSVAYASSLYPRIPFSSGDIENSHLPSDSADIICLFGVLHHFPDFTKLADEVRRVLKPGGRFFAIDPHQWNPLFWLHRSRSSPFYSSEGITANERLLTRGEIRDVFGNAGFRVQVKSVSGVNFSTEKSPNKHAQIHLFNVFDRGIQTLRLDAWLGAWLITSGVKDDTASNKLQRP